MVGVSATTCRFTHSPFYLSLVVNNVKSSDNDIIMVDASQNYDPNKNGNLKGRKRFNADLADLQEAVKFGLTFDSLVVKSELLGSTSRTLF